MKKGPAGPFAYHGWLLHHRDIGLAVGLHHANPLPGNECRIGFLHHNDAVTILFFDLNLDAINLIKFIPCRLTGSGTTDGPSNRGNILSLATTNCTPQNTTQHATSHGPEHRVLIAALDPDRSSRRDGSVGDSLYRLGLVGAIDIPQ